MRKNQIRYILVIVTVLCCAVLIPRTIYSFHEHTLKYGSRGMEVTELQGRLQYIGYYSGKIDGVYGRSTQLSVRTFQSRFGLTADGVAGPRTKQMLLKATSAWNWGLIGGATGSGRTFTKSELKLLARAVYAEARGEPYTGQVAIAAVIINRVHNPNFPKTVSGVIFQPGAFTAVDDGQIWMEPNATAYKAAYDAVFGWDPSGNAIYYFNPATATSKWIWSRPQIKRIGKHIFCK